MSYEKRNQIDEVPAHVQRVLDEHNDLYDKVGKLEAFILQNPLFKTLDPEEQRDMRQQYDAMTLYRDILKSRLQRAGV